MFVKRESTLFFFEKLGNSKATISLSEDVIAIATGNAKAAILHKSGAISCYESTELVHQNQIEHRKKNSKYGANVWQRNAWQNVNSQLIFKTKIAS